MDEIQKIAIENTLSPQIIDNFDLFINHFDLELEENEVRYSGVCCIHCGDNIAALQIYKNNQDIYGFWTCHTHQCHEDFKPSAFGFVMALLSKEKLQWSSYGDDQVSWEETKTFILNILDKQEPDIKIDKEEMEKRAFSRQYKEKEEIEVKRIHKSKLIGRLGVPSQYFLSRGFSENVLKTYDVCDCIDDKKEMRYRAVVPVYDETGEYMVGCTGRSLFEKCKTCKLYHSPKKDCPTSDLGKFGLKWKHSAGSKLSRFLYNYCLAKPHIVSSQTIIVVESPGNVWRMAEAGIHNVVGLFGVSMSKSQKKLLGLSGAMNAILILDNDENKAGNDAQDKILIQLSRLYRVTSITPTTNDLGEMSVEQIKSEILPQIQNFVDKHSL